MSGVRDAARWSVMDGETRAVIERERARYEVEDRVTSVADVEAMQAAVEWVREQYEADGTWVRVGSEQDRQAGADESKDKTERQGKSKTGDR